MRQEKNSKLIRSGIRTTILLLANFLFQISAMAYEYVVTLEPTQDLQYQLQEAVIKSKPDTLIQLPAGFYTFDDEIVIDTSHITLKGQGMEKTILSFKNQPNGAQGLLVLADAFVAEDFAIEDTAGDGLRVERANGVRINRVRVEWTGGPSEKNGAYGLYPVRCKNILIENSTIIGASDAGIYVGQSSNIIVRENRAEFNVAGIEIENSTHADVYNNTVRHNTAGVLVFDLAGIPMRGGYSRVFNNIIENNNTINFAPPGNIVGIVPSGTGVMIMGTDNVDVFNNVIKGNKTTGVFIASYYAPSCFFL